MEDVYADNMKLEEEYKTAFLIALSKYPELKNSRVNMQSDINARFTMQVLPVLKSIYKTKENREVTVSMYSGPDTNRLRVMDLNHNTLVGWFAHELVHVMDELSKNVFQNIALGVHIWLSDRFSALYERDTDLRGIQRGLGYALHEGMVVFFNGVSIKPDRKLRMEKYYLAPDEILLLSNMYHPYQ